MQKRYTKIALPSYKYIPNKGPHPLQIKNVRHIPEIPDNNSDFSNENWQQSQQYLYAIDLFNLGYYWEVHEVLEKLWMQLGKNSDEGIFIQGLIQLSVALLKNTQKNFEGVKRLFDKALPKLKKKQGVYMGINVESFLLVSQKYINDGLEQPRIELIFHE